MESIPAVQVDDVSKRYGTRWALARLSFTVGRGESLLLTGHNGSGKTTLLRVLATALSPTAGKMRVLGFDAASSTEEIRSRVGLLSHASFLYEDLTAEQNLVLLARLIGKPVPSLAAKTLLEQVGLLRRAGHPVREFSAGMRKRLALARLLMKSPEVALLDEPFGELDPDGVTLAEGIIRGLQARGTTLILATHLVEQGERLCSRRLHLKDGRAVVA